MQFTKFKIWATCIEFMREVIEHHFMMSCEFSFPLSLLSATCWRPCVFGAFVVYLIHNPDGKPISVRIMVGCTICQLLSL